MSGTDGKGSPVTFPLVTEFTEFPMLGNKTHLLLFMRLDGGLMLEGMAEMNGGNWFREGIVSILLFRLGKQFDKMYLVI